METEWGVEYAPALDPTGLILRAISPLCAQGMPPSKAAYFEQRLYPLLVTMVEMVMDQLPEHLEPTIAEWLLQRLGAPTMLVNKVRASLLVEQAEEHRVDAFGEEDPQEAGPAPLAPCTAPRGGQEVPHLSPSGRKRQSWTTPGGTHVSDEAARRLSDPDLVRVSERDRLELLQHIPAFQNLDAETMLQVARSCSLLRFLDGEEIQRAGAPSDGMHVIVSGSCSIWVFKKTGICAEGDSFGHTQLLANAASTETLEATGGPLTTLFLSAEDFRNLGLPGKLNRMRRRSRADCNRAEALRHERTTASLVEHPESDVDRQLIAEALQRSPTFGEVMGLSAEQAQVLSRQARLYRFHEGEVVFRKGETGKHFYVVQEGIFEYDEAGRGSLDSSPSAAAAGPPSSTLRAGDSFNELALLYTSPSPATARCLRDGSVWGVSRAAVQQVLQGEAKARMMEYNRFFSFLEGLSWVNEQDRIALCGALEEICFVKGENVVVQGEPADSFYIIFDGTCAVYEDGIWKGELETGKCFGERALLQNIVRTATVQVSSDRCTLLVLNRLDFELLMYQRQAPGADGCITDLPSQAVIQGGLRPPGGRPSVSLPAARHSARLSLKGNALLPAGDLEAFQQSLDGCDATDVGSNGQFPEDEEPGLIPWTRLERVGMLGKGSFGYVTLERDAQTGVLYALKAMSKGNIVKERLQEVVKNEKISMEMLCSDFVVQLHGTYRDDQHVYLLQEACFGGELFDLFETKPELFGNEELARFYAGCCTYGLDHMHSRRIVYRDLKLENCLLSANGYLKLTDLGLAKVVVGKTYTVCGTTDYFAPETLRQTGHNRAVDWWALGVMIFIMMSGRAPFEAPDAMQTYKLIMKGFVKFSFPDSMGQSCVKVVQGLCRKKPEERLTMGNVGIQSLQEHLWFQGFDWNSLLELSLPAPHNIAVSEEQVALKASQNCVEPFSEVPYEEDGTGWDDVFAEI